MPHSTVVRTLFVAASAGLAVLLAACTDAPAPASTPASTSTGVATSATSATPSATAAPAKVASTGASIPVNGKPTLVFVDTIW